MGDADLDPDNRVDFEKVRENAAKDGIELRYISIKYVGLTGDELDDLSAHGLLTHALSSTSALGRFADDGSVLFPEKAIAVFCLGE